MTTTIQSGGENFASLHLREEAALDQPLGRALLGSAAEVVPVADK
jgi:hypothetical protein